jgi:hypothetical protein
VLLCTYHAMSKGSTRRPATVSPQSVRDAWDRTFRPPSPPSDAPTQDTSEAVKESENHG